MGLKASYNQRVALRKQLVSRTFFALLLSLLLSACIGESAAETSGQSSVPPQGSTFGIVKKVVDGDTVILSIEGEEENVRLIGIDTPESVKPNAPQECFGKESTDFLSSLLPIGSSVRIERDEEPRDRYKRLLLYLYRAEDELFINKVLVQEGYAQAKSYKPNTAKQSELFQALQEAQEQEKGLWKNCDGPNQPLP